jgi:lipopolysaccharide biosynthesis glycosyltransferase
MPSVLPIACAINERYLLPLSVMLESVKRRLRPAFQPVLYLVHTGIPQACLDIVSSIVETRPIVPSAAQLAAAPSNARLSPEASFPLLLADLLPRTLERVLFLDADLLALDDLVKLWETPLERHVLAAAPDGAVPFCSSARGVREWRTLGIPPDAPYFNSGVLVIHLERWRERRVTRRVRQVLESGREPLDFLHQGPMNAVLWNDWQPLDIRWNLPSSRAGRPHGRIPPEAWQKPGIVHFAGRMKPWRAPVGGPFNAPYRELLERVLPIVKPEPPQLRDGVQSFYDRYCRAIAYPLEQLLWRRGWI